MSNSKLPVAEINHLISAVNRANAAMKKFYEASGVHADKTIDHFMLLESGFPYFRDAIRRGGRFVETRPSSRAVETRSGNTC